MFEREDRRVDYGKTRVQAIGRIEGRSFVVVYTARGTVRPTISARRAHEEEFERWTR